MNQIQYVTNFEDLIATPFEAEVNAICWQRELVGDFSEIVSKVLLDENIATISYEELMNLDLSEQGKLAREMLLNDIELLKANGASPILNAIKYYDADDSFFPTDVYSFHVDRAPIQTATFLCTYHGTPSEIVPNSQAEQKILIPAIRTELRKHFKGTDKDFESYLSENFYDLHYQPKPHADIFSLGIGNLWKVSVDYPESPVLPCLHRAPKEKSGLTRLLLIC